MLTAFRSLISRILSGKLTFEDIHKEARFLEKLEESPEFDMDKGARESYLAWCEEHRMDPHRPVTQKVLEEVWTAATEVAARKAKLIHDHVANGSERDRIREVIDAIRGKAHDNG